VGSLGQQKAIGITKRLLRWFDRNKRQFPWRETFERPDPYKILFTEIMLQRTTARQVAPVYEEFVKKYPTLEMLSNAPDMDVFGLFSQLGLRWRAKNIAKLIAALRDRHHGLVPTNPSDLRDLPGVGEYVACAVECYAFGRRVVPVDTNVVRVIARLFGLHLDPDLARRSKLIKDLAAELAPTRRIRDFNLALLDFAATVCKPQPMCDVCPLALECAYFQAGSLQRLMAVAS